MKTVKNNGIAIIIVMIFIITLVGLATIAFRAVGTQVNIANSQIDNEKAFYIAEAGAEKGMDYVANRGTLPKAIKTNIGEGRCYITIATKATAGDNSGPSINGLIHLGSSGSALVSLNTGSATITSKTLTKDYSGYIGPAKSVIIKLTGNGAQTGLTIDSQTYPLEAGKRYVFSSGTMQVALFNDKLDRSNKAIGNWHISIAATDATVTN